MITLPDIGVVAIGRNEGGRLRACLASTVGRGPAAVVYVDSASTDGSVDAARAAGAEVVELDMSVPFTAARARNAGFERLSAALPGLAFVQFLDADCELVEGWLPRARAAWRAGPTWPSPAAAAASATRESRPTIDWPTSSGTPRWARRRPAAATPWCAPRPSARSAATTRP